jgi:hypothetical protein
MHKTLTALAAAAAMTLAIVAVPDQADARWRGHGGGVAAGIIGGLAAGAIIGGIAANQGYYGGPGYYGQSYYPGTGYYYDPYAYEAPVYVRPAPRYYRGGYGVQNGCWIATDTTRGFGYYGPCN